MTYREQGNSDLYEEHLRDIVLRRHSAFGPWLVMGLGLALTFFLSYIVYSNLLLPSIVPPSPERSLRTMADSTPATPVSLSDPVSPLPLPPWGTTTTSVPQSRASDAFLGGEGPALLRLAVTANNTPETRSRAAAISP